MCSGIARDRLPCIDTFGFSRYRGWIGVGESFLTPWLDRASTSTRGLATGGTGSAWGTLIFSIFGDISKFLHMHTKTNKSSSLIIMVGGSSAVTFPKISGDVLFQTKCAKSP